MLSDRDLHGALRGVLDEVENAAPVEAVDAATSALADALDATSASLLIADLSGRALVRMAHVAGHPDGRPRGTGLEASAGGAAAVRRDEDESATAVALDDGPVGLAMRSQAVQVVPPGAMPGEGDEPGWTVLAPVTERGEALGLLELVLPDEPDARVVAEIARTAHLLGFVVIAARRHTGLFEWAQRSTRYSLSAEIQRRLLPAAYTCEAGSFTLAAWLEPSASVGGDTYDYSLARDVLHLSLTDAMGHGVGSALTATLCVGSLRNTRQRGALLTEQAAAANDALNSYQTTISGEGFCTGLLGRLDLATGALELLNAGHIAPYLLRDGAVQRVELVRNLPLGMFPQTRFASVSLDLHPGDRLVLVTDGMVERNAQGLDLAAAIVETRAEHPREATRALTGLVLEATGHSLADDATLLMLDWNGGHGQGRSTRAGTPSRGR